MENVIQTVDIEKLIAHPDNPNRQSKSNFSKLVRNIERTGKYEPLVVRPHPQKAGYFQLINGHHRCKALEQLGHKQACAIVWDIDDEQTDILLATLNRLSGSDDLGKKLLLLKRLNNNLNTKELAKLIPQTAGQIEKLVTMKMPSAPAQTKRDFLNPLVFFITDRQQRIIEHALSLACENNGTKACQRATALTQIANCFAEQNDLNV